MKYHKLPQGRFPKYDAGEITSAYQLRDGSTVAHCPSTGEWLKWNSNNQLHSSFGKTREEAAQLDNE
jgi:hypothetical protein